MIPHLDPKILPCGALCDGRAAAGEEESGILGVK